MKNSIAQLWTVIRYIIGCAVAFAGLLLALPCALLYAIANGLTTAADKIVPKEVRKDTGKEIIEEIVTE